jgi:hypothetical protein
MSLSIMTLNRLTLRKMTFTIRTLRKMTHGITMFVMAHSTMPLIIMNDTQHNNCHQDIILISLSIMALSIMADFKMTQHDSTQYDDGKHKWIYCNSQYNKFYS